MCVQANQKQLLEVGADPPDEKHWCRWPNGSDGGFSLSEALPFDTVAGRSERKWKWRREI